MTAATEAFRDLSIELLDSNDGVTEHENVLLVHGQPFAMFVDGALAVRLPKRRSDDLLRRGIVTPHDERADWTLVKHRSLWPEMAREAHEFVGEPAVGRES